MSAHYGAPGFRRPQMATPAYSAVAQGSSIPARSAPRPPAVKRRALLVAAATLCAPALAVVALAAIGATGGGNQAGMGSLPGSEGLRGSTTAAPSAEALSTAGQGKHELTKQKGIGSASHARTHDVRQHPASSRPAHRPTPPPSTHTKRTPPHPVTTSPSPGTSPYDPLGPGSPTGSDSTAGPGGTTTGSGSVTGTGSTSGTGSGASDTGSGSGTSVTSDGWDGSPGGG
jgi:hypothetical protein